MNTEEQINQNAVLQAAAQEAQRGYESLYRSAILRNNKVAAAEHREKVLACMGEFLDLVMANYELHQRLLHE
jgi:hypothetical protein